jgi:hypothetical protein
LNWPEQLLYGLVGALVLFAVPQGVNQVFNTNDSVCSEQLLDQNVITDGGALVGCSFEEATFADHIVKNLLWRLSVPYVVADEEYLLQVVNSWHDERAVVDFFQAKFVQYLLSLGRCIPRFLNSHHKEKNVNRDALVFRQSKWLNIYFVKALGSVKRNLISLVVNIVSVLLHVVRRKNFRHEDFDATSSFQAVVLAVLATLGHLLFSTSVNSALFIEIVSLSFP